MTSNNEYETSAAPSVPGYKVLEQLTDRAQARTYRALQGDKPVIIKILHRKHPSFAELLRFRNRYTITRHLNHPGIACPLGLKRYGSGYVLIFPDEGVISLRSYWQRQQCSVGEVLQIALQLTEVLHYLIKQHIIHKGIGPDNILIHPVTRQIQLTNFSIASLLSKEHQQLTSPNILESPLAYCSPEQTGRMNRGIDYRTDFYSLGVTLFELLVGEPPFTTHDPMALVYCHMARPVLFPAACRRNIPDRLQAIIVKLMAKNAEERYQSALGLKHDLERCLQQWESGELVSFQLGEQDRCDRFLIPEVLYGRETSVNALMAAFDRVAVGKTEIMLVAGFSGIGKTAVVKEVHKPIARQKGYFIQGKFDQLNRNVPFSAFVQAFRNLIGQLLGESDEALARWQTLILKAVGASGQVILEVLPELEQIIGEQPPIPELSGIAAQNRFNLIFGKFVRVFATQDHPLVVFLDDLQWADPASLNLLKLVVGGAVPEYLLMLGAYRDNEVFPAHPLMLTLNDIQKQWANLNTLTLMPLEAPDINQLVADTLLCSVKRAEPLSQLVYQKTRGNPFFTTQFLTGLYEENCITFNADGGYWQCDLTQVRQLALTDDVVEFMVGRLRKLPAATQKVLKLAACIGNQFDLSTLAVVCDCMPDEAAAMLWRGLQENFVIPQSDTYKFFQGESLEDNDIEPAGANYRFLHDRVQQAAYSLIPEAQKSATHLGIGQLLLAQTPAGQTDERIFAIVNQLNRGISLLEGEAQLATLARLNLRAGCKAKASVAYSAAVDYLQTGIELLQSDRWRDPHNLTLPLYNAAAEAAYLDSNYALMEQYLEEIFQYAPTLLDQIAAYEVKIQAKIAQNQLQECVDTGCSVLEQLGIHLSYAPTPAVIEAGFANTAALLDGKAPTDLLTLPEMDAPEPLAALKILSGIWGAAFSVAPPLMPLIVLAMVNLSIRYGNAPVSAFAYALYGVLLCSREDFQGGHAFSDLSLDLLAHFNTQTFKAKILFLIGTHIKIWYEPIRAALPMLEAAYQAGLETGDLEFAALPAAIGAYYAYLAGMELAEVKQRFVDYTQAVERINQTYYLNFLRIWHQAVTNLLEGSDAPNRLVGAICNGEALLAAFERDSLSTPMAYIHLNRLILSYGFHHHADAVKIVPLAAEYAEAVPSTLLIPIANFYGSLARLALAAQLSDSEQDVLLQAVESNQAKMELWSRWQPENYRHKHDLVAAERYRLLGNRAEAIALYDAAISGAKENEFLQEEALANELAAKFYLDWGKPQIARAYLLEAYYCYARWGSKAKTDFLAAIYPEALHSALQPPLPLFNPLESFASIAEVSSNAEIPINNPLDLAAILKAAQVISSTIDLDMLLTQLTQILLQNSGGDRCILVLSSGDGWQVRATATPDAVELSADPIENHPTLPLRLLHYVRHSQEVVVLDDLVTDLPVIDTSLMQQQPKSLLCAPIFNQGRVIGILYLVNQLVRGVFTHDRVLVLNFLCTQAAISLENAYLYQQAQVYARQIEQSELQIVQSEKTLALGNLVAGVAHELNNPIGFISGNVEELKKTLADILDHLQLHQQQASTNEIQQHARQIDIDYLFQDVPKMLASMSRGCERIESLSNSLRIFSRTDIESKVMTNLHDMINATLVILKYRLKFRGSQPNIDVIRDYGDLPEISCFPGQLNQVFMNILANAIDMFDELLQEGSDDNSIWHPQQITIRTCCIHPHRVEIRVADNGKGMSDEIQTKIFDRGFTTKVVGKGTGLGLAIAYQVVVEKHGGSLEVRSEIGKGTEFIICLPTH